MAAGLTHYPGQRNAGSENNPQTRVFPIVTLQSLQYIFLVIGASLRSQNGGKNEASLQTLLQMAKGPARTEPFASLKGAGGEQSSPVPLKKIGDLAGDFNHDERRV